MHLPFIGHILQLKKKRQSICSSEFVATVIVVIKRFLKRTLAVFIELQVLDIKLNSFISFYNWIKYKFKP